MEGRAAARIYGSPRGWGQGKGKSSRADETCLGRGGGGEQAAGCEDVGTAGVAAGDGEAGVQSEGVEEGVACGVGGREE